MGPKCVISLVIVNRLKGEEIAHSGKKIEEWGSNVACLCSCVDRGATQKTFRYQTPRGPWSQINVGRTGFWLLSQNLANYFFWISSCFLPPLDQNADLSPPPHLLSNWLRHGQPPWLQGSLLYFPVNFSGFFFHVSQNINFASRHFKSKIPKNQLAFFGCAQDLLDLEYLWKLERICVSIFLIFCIN